MSIYTPKNKSGIPNGSVHKTKPSELSLYLIRQTARSRYVENRLNIPDNDFIMN
jgi:hypothetical protein